MWEGGPPGGGGETLSPQSLDSGPGSHLDPATDKIETLTGREASRGSASDQAAGAALPSARRSEGADSCPRLDRRLRGRPWLWSRSPSAGGEKDIS